MRNSIAVESLHSVLLLVAVHGCSPSTSGPEGLPVPELRVPINVELSDVSAAEIRAMLASPLLVLTWPVYDGGPSDAATVCEHIPGGAADFVSRSFVSTSSVTDTHLRFETKLYRVVAKEEPQVYRLALVDRSRRGAVLASFELPPPVATFEQFVCAGLPADQCYFQYGVDDCQVFFDLEPRYAPNDAVCFSALSFVSLTATIDSYLPESCAAAQGG